MSGSQPLRHTTRGEGAGWGLFTGCPGWAALADTAGTNALDTAFVDVDRFLIYRLRSGSSGTFSWALGGGAATTIGGTGTNAFDGIAVDAGSLGDHTLRLRRVAGNVWIDGVIASKSTATRVHVINWGASGTVAFNHAVTTSPWSPAAALATIAPDLTIINLTINDGQAATAVGPLGVSTAYLTSLQTIVTQAKISGDVLLMTGAPSAIGAVALGRQLMYIEAYRYISKRNECPMISTMYEWGSYDQANANGLMGDTLHPDGEGATAQARLAATEML
jgi:lysophospholipase L1-like esterase